MPQYIFRCDDCSQTIDLFCSMSEYDSKSQSVLCPVCEKKTRRDYSGDNIRGSVSISLSDCKTIGHYADKQTEKYGHRRVEDMMHDFKTQKEGGMKELPSGMSRMKKSPNTIQWTKETNKKKRSKKRRDK